MVTEKVSLVPETYGGAAAQIISWRVVTIPGGLLP